MGIDFIPAVGSFKQIIFSAASSDKPNHLVVLDLLESFDYADIHNSFGINTLVKISIFIS
ncbi:hypothetical protein [Paraglaciecola sp. L3A3]|uniref:hypothetical protein n=1 Tax=Paraglaciecola sp. L3A3 TaxID=2686358 RepID=UPI0018EF2A92|nr:hypothetical protein [Paraglaciecola sp. L3A3]